MDVPDIERLEQIFSNAIAPSFFLGAVAAFITLMMSQLASVNERIEVSNKGAAADASSVSLRMLKRRARLLSDGILLSLGGGICATLLLAMLFASQFLGFRHAYGAAVLFVVATLLMGTALIRFAEEVWQARRGEGDCD